jgi:hypothetical protein
MIDLDKVIYWFCVLSAMWFVGWMSHVVTMKSVSEEINRLVPVHTPAPSVEDRIPFPGVESMSRLDSVAFCQALINTNSNR